MKIDLYCFKCQFGRIYELAKEQPDREKQVQFMRACLLELGNAPDDDGITTATRNCTRRYKEIFGIEDRYAEEKRRSNEYAIAKLPDIRRRIDESGDRLRAALKYARVGNYIDFGALGGHVSYEELDGLIDRESKKEIDLTEYENLRRDLKTAKKLLYLTDNAGEAVLDKLCIEIIKEEFPKLDICVAVRGGKILNDVDMDTAKEIGLTDVARVISNGSDLAGTLIAEVSEEMRGELESADVILAKGMGNFETMWGCGLNVYYSFLCKCELYVRLFDVPRFTGMFINEKRITVEDKF